jgi:hypothetical protein
METLGHPQISLTLNTYSHVLPSLQQEAAAKMNTALTPSERVRVDAWAQLPQHGQRAAVRSIQTARR